MIPSFFVVVCVVLWVLCSSFDRRLLAVFPLHLPVFAFDQRVDNNRIVDRTCLGCHTARSRIHSFTCARLEVRVDLNSHFVVSLECLCEQRTRAVFRFGSDKKGTSPPRSSIDVFSSFRLLCCSHAVRHSRCECVVSVFPSRPGRQNSVHHLGDRPLVCPIPRGGTDAQ